MFVFAQALQKLWAKGNNTSSCSLKSKYKLLNQMPFTRQAPKQRVMPTLPKATRRAEAGLGEVLAISPAVLSKETLAFETRFLFWIWMEAAALLGYMRELTCP